MYEAKQEQTSSLPKPKGYKILIKMPKVSEKTEGGIYRPDEFITREETAAAVGFVIDQGPDAYNDKERFPNGSWCLVGDWVVINPYTGTRFKVDGFEYRLINDDSVQAVVNDPGSIQRA